jgi:predicted nucleic acid-binding protein
LRSVTSVISRPRGYASHRTGIEAGIAQSCIDQSVPLVTRDKDFRQFAGKSGLSLL